MELMLGLWIHGTSMTGTVVATRGCCARSHELNPIDQGE